jgi:crotonobetaine/carnitine-CoA ligase
VMGHPSVLECAVVGVPADVEAGEDEVLAVVVVEGNAAPAEILAWCEGKIPAFAIPRYLRVVAELPKTPSQKIRKAVLRAETLGPETFDRQAVHVS